MSAAEIQPRIVICVLHDRPEAIEAICADSSSYEYDNRYSDCGPDERIPKAFEYSWDRVRPSATDEDKESVLAHRNVAYAVSRFITPDTAQKIASDGLSLIARSLAEGARAVKCDSSGIAHGRKKWLEFAGSKDQENLYFSFVRRPLGADLRMYSCGMHLIGLPDTEVIGFSDWEATRIIDAFSRYLITEEGDRRVQSGHTFCCSPDDPVLTVQKIECHGYEKDDFFYNPYGYWRLEPKKEHNQSAQTTPVSAPR